MREIRFRAWVVKDFTSIGEGFESTMYHDISVGDGDDGYFYNMKNELTGKSDDSFDMRDDDVNLMQYTGLKDKNGVKIFEGDVVKISKTNSNISPDVGTVTFEDCSYLVTHGDRLFTHLSYPDRIEVIGNIHEGDKK